uniref:Reverse transcriptase domain-containing protein n=1 Tax=Astyanax mexicanus TaxID=7994 RepID=A0A3B1J5L7_ASTMX
SGLTPFQCILGYQPPLAPGVKQGCPLSAALYVLAISPLITKIRNDERLQGVIVGGRRVVISAYADDVTIFIKSKNELEIILEYFKMYENASGAVLNVTKSECVWIGNPENKFMISIPETENLKVLGIYFNNKDSVETNWSEKVEVMKAETKKWTNCNLSYKTRINIVKTYILSKILFLSCILPPTDKWLKTINKLCCNFIWNSTREVTKRNLLYKKKELGGLGALDFSIKTKISVSTTSELTDLWNKQTGADVSRSTTYRRLRELGFKSRVPAVKPMLNKKQMEKRLKWAKEHGEWTAEDWQKVVFSDESRFCISFGDQGPRVWRRGGETYNHECVKRSVKFPQSVMVWGCMSA